jgi:hypothetical protein
MAAIRKSRRVGNLDAAGCRSRQNQCPALTLIRLGFWPHHRGLQLPAHQFANVSAGISPPAGGGSHYITSTRARTGRASPRPTACRNRVASFGNMTGTGPNRSLVNGHGTHSHRTDRRASTSIGEPRARLASPATRSMAVAMITAPSGNDTHACRSASRRIVLSGCRCPKPGTSYRS